MSKLFMMDAPATKAETEHEKYVKSAEWKMLLEKEKKAKFTSYTVTYCDVNGELKEAWHVLTDNNIEYVKAKYKKANKEIISFVPKGK
jgi:hypothetical protein